MTRYPNNEQRGDQHIDRQPDRDHEMDKVEQAKVELLRWKSYLPFRQWCAAEINGEWKCYDSRRKMLAAIRKAGLTQAMTMEAQ